GERWPNRPKHHRLGLGTGNDKATNENAVPTRNDPPSREVKHFRLDCRELRIFQMNRNGVVGSVTTCGRVLIIENLFVRGVQAQELCIVGRGQRAIHKRIIYHVIEWGILVDAATERTENAFTLRIIPDFGSDVRRYVNAVLTGAGKPGVRARRRLKQTGLTVIEEQ